MSIYLSGRNFTVSARAVARGDDKGAVVKAPVRVKPDRFGVHTMRLEVQVRNDLVESFLPQIGDLDPFRQTLVYDPGSLDITYGELQRGIIACEFRGVIQSRPNQFAQREAGFNERTVRLRRDADDVVISVTYKGPRTTFYYATATDPLAPNFAGQLQPSSDAFEIIEIRGPNDEDISALLNMQLLTDNGFFHEYATRTTVFDRKEDGAGVWRNTEVNEGIILQGVTPP